MTKKIVPDVDVERARREKELRIQRQIGFASGLFQEEVTVRTVLESVAEGVVVIDETGTILLVNSRAEAMFGYSRQELIGKPHAMLIPEQFRLVHEGHEVVYFREPRIRPMGLLLDLAGRRNDGSEFPIEISLGFIETGHGILVMAFISDITARKEYESRMRESDDQFRIQVECVKEYAIFMLDAGGNVHNWNAGAERLEGYREEEIVGQHFSCFYLLEDRRSGIPEKLLRQAQDEGQAVTEGWRLRKDGSRFWAEVVVTAMRDKSGTLRGFSKVTHDMTERKRAENALQESEQRFSSFMLHLPAAAWIKDLDGRYVYANREAKRVFAAPSYEVEGRIDDELFPPEVAKQFRENDQQALTENRTIRTTETLRDADGTEHYSMVSKFNVPGADGRTAYVAGVAFDITDRVRAEEAMRRSEQKFSRIFNAAPALIGISTLEAGRIVDMNPEALRILGYRRDEVIGRTGFDLNLLEDKKDRNRIIQVLKEQGSVHNAEIRFIGKTGQVFSGLLSAELIDLEGERCVLSLVKDITARKQAELEQEQTLLKLESVLEGITEGVMIADLAGNVVKLNKEAVVILGFKRIEEGYRPLKEYLEIFELFDLKGRLLPYEERPLARALRGERFVNHQVKVHRKDIGKSFIASYSGTPVKGKSGEPILAVVTIRDITSQKTAEEALRKSENKFSTIFHSAPVLILLSTAREGTIIDVNETFLSTLGYRKEEVLGRTTEEIGMWENIADRAAILGMLREGSVRNVEVRWKAKTGRILVGLYSGEFIQLNGERCIVGSVQDITERKQVEEALVRAKEEWELTFDTVPDLIAVLDERHRIVRVNRAMAMRLGRQPAEFTGLPCHEIIHQAGVPPGYCPHAGTMSDGREHQVEVHEPVLNGDFLVSTTPLIGTDGKMNGVVHVARDITEQKKAAGEIERLNTDLRAHSAELEFANRELEAFSYTVAHDLRKPLTVINGYVQAVMALCGDQLEHECLSYVREAYEGTLRMNRLIDSLLLFSQAAHAEPKRESVDLSTIAHEVAEELKLAEPTRSVEFRITQGISVNGDSSLLRVVIANLFGNAWKYTEERGEAVIEFGSAETASGSAFFVRDNGIGFNPAEAGEVFTAFRRLPRGRRVGGLGIGLATVARIIERHGGKVWAEGEPGKGAAFYFTLPTE